MFFIFLPIHSFQEHPNGFGLFQVWSRSRTCPQNGPGVYTAAGWLAVLSQVVGPGPKYFISQLKHTYTHSLLTRAHTRGDECVITLIKLLLEGRRSSVGNGGETHRWLFTSLYTNHSWNREGGGWEIWMNSLMGSR